MNLATHITWLALCVYHEAKGEELAGKKAVVQIILNRVDIRVMALTKVIQERYQFSWYNPGFKTHSIERKDYDLLAECSEAVSLAFIDRLNGYSLLGADHYYAFQGSNKIIAPYWVSSMAHITDIDNHRFLRDDTRNSPSYLSEEEKIALYKESYE